MTWYSPSTLALILANLLPLYGVVFWNWSVLALMVLFWLEVVLIALLTVLRMLCADPSNRALWLNKLVFVPLSCALFAIVVLGVGIMMYQFFGSPEGVVPMQEGVLPIAETRQVAGKHGLWPGIAALVASHLFSFFWNYLGGAEFRRAKLMTLVERFFLRVTMIVVALWFGAFFMVEVIRQPIWGLLALVLLKLWLDLDAHIEEHRQAASSKVQRGTD